MKTEKITCPYCGNEAEWVENKEIYGKNYGKSYMMWLCRPCEAFVGCHNNTRRPLGSLANRELRMWRKATHSLIDTLWKTKQVSRGHLYNILKDQFGREIHVGESDIKTCKEIIEFAKSNLINGGIRNYL